MKWEKVEIGQLGEVITGNTPPRKNPELYGDFIPFIKPTDIEIDRRYTPNPEECYSELGYEKYRKSLIPKGATCVVTIGSIGKKMTQAITDCFINQAVNAIIPNENYNRDFVFYLLRNNLDKVKGLDSGTSSGRENVSKSAFSSIEVKVTKHLPTQRRIASILSAYDDLIENNLKRIKLLEEKAFANYKLLDKVEKFKLSDLYDTSSGGTPSRTNAEFFTGEINWFKSKELTDSILLESEEKITEVAVDKSSAKLFPAGSVIMAMYGATIGKLGLLSQPSTTNQACCAIIEKNIVKSNYYILNWLLENREYVLSFRMGAAQENISQQVIKNLVVLIPKDSNMKLFNLEMKPIYHLIKNLHQQNTKLREARDILLPRLMSGEIEV